jgi:hypothetical protein
LFFLEKDNSIEDMLAGKFTFQLIDKEEENKNDINRL